jgi:hypothetical protein
MGARFHLKYFLYATLHELLGTEAIHWWVTSRSEIFVFLRTAVRFESGLIMLTSRSINNSQPLGADHKRNISTSSISEGATQVER